MKLTEEQKEIREDLINSYITEDIINAYSELVGEDYIEDVEEAYNGQWGSDEEFAEQMAEDLGLIDNDGKWPHYCIDWEWAARELMMDYMEQDGYYFRCL